MGSKWIPLLPRHSRLLLGGIMGFCSSEATRSHHYFNIHLKAKQQFDPRATTRVEIAACGRTNQHSALVWLSHADYIQLINSKLMKKKTLADRGAAATEPVTSPLARIDHHRSPEFTLLLRFLEAHEENQPFQSFPNNFFFMKKSCCWSVRLFSC